MEEKHEYTNKREERCERRKEKYMKGEERNEGEGERWEERKYGMRSKEKRRMIETGRKRI